MFMRCSLSSGPTDFPPGAAAISTISAPKRWTSSRWPPMTIVAWIVLAFVIEEWLVIEKMVWPGAGADALWIARAVALLLAATVTWGLWMTHFLDPGVIPPKKEVDADVSWFLALNRPHANVFTTSQGRGGGGGGDGDGDGDVKSDFVVAVTDDNDDDDKRSVRMVTRFSKDYKGQPIKSTFPERLLDPEDPEGPLLKGGVTPEFCVEAVTVRYCVTCNIWRPPRSSHCSTCGYCMARFDHHCPMVATCVARRNHAWFAFMLLSGGTACASYAVSAAVRANQVCDSTLGRGSACWEGYEIWLIIVYGFFIAYASSCLIGFGVYNVINICCRDVTMKEQFGGRGRRKEILNTTMPPTPPPPPPGGMREPPLGQNPMTTTTTKTTTSNGNAISVIHSDRRRTRTTTTTTTTTTHDDAGDVCCTSVRMRPWYD